MVVLESTTYPGTTEQLMPPVLEEGSGLRAGTDFLQAYSPERIDPGNDEFGLRNTPRVAGGTTAQATEAAVAFYGQLVDKAGIASPWTPTYLSWQTALLRPATPSARSRTLTATPG